MKKLFFIIILAIIDQTTKHLPFWEKACNPYISWSIPLDGLLLWIFILIALSFLFYTLKKTNFPYSLLLITAGAFGNIIDRLHLGCVIDFISLTIPIIGVFPTFNLADTFITIGISLFIWKEFFTKIKNRKSQQDIIS